MHFWRLLRGVVNLRRRVGCGCVVKDGLADLLLLPRCVLGMVFNAPSKHW